MNRLAFRLLSAACVPVWLAVAGGIAAAAPAAADRDLDFAARILPILTRHGCNSGGCHGAGLEVGKNGFYLSLFGFDPERDHARIAAAARGRYLDFAAPDESLLLQKPSGVLPHGGGLRIPRDSAAYATLRRWIEAGAPRGDPAQHALRGLAVEPATRIARPGERLQMKVTALYADGSSEDVTALARCESNDPALATIAQDGTGSVTVGDLPGDVAIVVRYRDQCGFLAVTIPRTAAAEGVFPPPSNFIDEHAFAKMRRMGLAPSPSADDGSFLRRVMIDIGGRVPTAKEAAAFLADTAPDKRAALIDRIIAGGDYATNFADKWVVLLHSNREMARLTSTYVLHDWLRHAFADNVPFDRLVRDLLTATGEHPAAGWWRSQRSLLDKQLANTPAERVKDATEDVAVLFLGQRIGCAKCHHHPFDRWSQADYHAFAAFFSRVQAKSVPGNALPQLNGPPLLIVHAHGEARIEHPLTGESLGPKLPGGQKVDVPADEDPRLRLAALLTAPDNPFFARAIVNRMWAHFFGRGIVDPEDDMRESNPPSNPALLDALTADFTAHGFDLQHLVRTICRSATYQAAATPNAGNRDDTRNFSRHQPRRLKAEVLLDAIDALAETQSKFGEVPSAGRAMELPDDRSGDWREGQLTSFLDTFGRQRGQAACECGRNTAMPGLGQSLTLINGDIIHGKLAAGRAKRLAAETSQPVADRIEELYLAAYARRPTEAEAAEVGAFLEGKKLSAEAFEDVLWALVNSKEFLFTR